jgi:hypothetical protein
MRLSVTLTDSNGQRSQRIEGLRWLRDLVSSYLRQGREIEIRTGGGVIVARRREKEGQR